MTSKMYAHRVRGGLWGAVVGDALGVPVEFEDRSSRKKNPVSDMQGYGTFNLPPGSWSDDSSLMLCVAESLLHGFNTGTMAELFMRWFYDAYHTPWGETFGVGGATRAAIERMKSGVPPEEAGGVDERDNGNGSLMRILPVALCFSRSPVAGIIEYASRASSITHRHLRSRMACGLYCLMVASLLKGLTPKEAYAQALDDALIVYREMPYSKELSHFHRLFSGKIGDLPEKEIHSGGYVIHTLEAGIWCLINSASYKEAVLKAVNLGYDTDTTGIVTGGLAGVTYGIDGIPEEWIRIIAGRDDINILFERFYDAIWG